MYKIYNGKWITFSSYKLLVNWLSQYNFFGCNHFLDKVGNNENDIGYDGIEYIKREYRILNGDGISIYNEKLKHDVINWVHDRELLQKWYKEINGCKNEHMIYKGYIIETSSVPKFRRGPWPLSGNKRYRVRAYRLVQTMNEKRQSVNCEEPSLVRKSRGKNLPSCYDFRSRGISNDGWKRQSKNRHQWQHRVEQKLKHSGQKNIYVDDRNTIRQSYDTDSNLDIGEL